MSDQTPASVGHTTEHLPEGGVAFDVAELEQIQKITERYPDRQAAVMPVLWMAQKKWGWLSLPVMQAVADALDLTLAHVQGVATFYTMYWKQPPGLWHLQVCRNLSCRLRGADEIQRAVEGRLGIRPGQKTADGRFSLEEVECLASCGTAPVLQVNNDAYHEGLDVARTLALLERLARE